MKSHTIHCKNNIYLLKSLRISSMKQPLSCVPPAPYFVSPSLSLAFSSSSSLSPGCRCLIQTWIWIIVPQEIQPLLLAPQFVCYHVSFCVNAVLASSVFMRHVLFPGLHGGEECDSGPTNLGNRSIFFTFVLQSTFLSSKLYTM